MTENKKLREEQDRAGANPYEVFDFDYFRTKFNLRTEELEAAIHEAKTNSPVELEEFLAKKFGLSKNGD